MTIAFASVSLGSTMGVNVDKGTSISIDKPSDNWDSLYITGNFGISDNLRLSVGYITEDEDDYDGFSLGVRYEFIENLAVNFIYETYDWADYYDLTLRGKMELSDQLALTGLIGYWRYDGGCDEYLWLMAQAEYSFNDFIIGNLGAQYDDSTECTYLIAGLEIYPTENFTFWADYSVDTDESHKDNFGFGVEFAF
jgi:hypothetical protein